MRPLLVVFAATILAPPPATGQAPPRVRGTVPETVVDSATAGSYLFRAGITRTDEMAIHVSLRGSQPSRDAAADWHSPDSVLAWVARASPDADESVVGSRTGVHVLVPGGERGRQRIGYVRFVFCPQGMVHSTNHQSFEPYRPLLAMLRRAAEIARPSAPPPEDGSAWWAHAVGCAAYPLGAPALEPDAEAAPLVARFVVGADGSPEPATLETLPGTPAERVEALRRALPSWRHQPATRGGRPVRQVVFTLVSPSYSAVRRFRAAVGTTPDGLVELRMPGGWGHVRVVHRAFFTPDEVDGWVARVRAGELPARLGGPHERALLRSTVLADTASPGGRFQLRVHPAGCGAWSTGPTGSTLVEKLRAAAAEARARPLRIDTVRVYARDEVDCPALPDSANDMPRARIAAGESTELHAAAVVGRDGRVEMESLRAMPGSDPALAEALRAVVPRWRFVPATRVGRPVRQMVLLPLVFRADGEGGIDTRWTHVVDP
ncbi:MAG TPA: hypothetical protein VFR81_30415 [Longimicrobium sp.]|nr:hypothetical protein [Longimicrobium sp.]